MKMITLLNPIQLIEPFTLQKFKSNSFIHSLFIIPSFGSGKIKFTISTNHRNQQLIHES